MNGATHTPDRPQVPSCSVDQIDWHSLRFGGMPAFERILRQLHAGYCELNDRLAAHLATPHDHVVSQELRDISFSYTIQAPTAPENSEANS